MMRAPLSRGKTGVVTVYDVVAVAPPGAGVVGPTPGSTLVTGYFTGQDLKTLLEFFLIDSAAHPGEYFPRASGMRFRYDLTRPKFDTVTAIELGDFDRDYKAVDTSGKDARLYSLTCPLTLGPIIVAIPKYTKGKLALVPKKKDGTPLTSKVDALEMPPENTGYLLPPPGTTDVTSVARGVDANAGLEIKEWQAIMDHLRRLPARSRAVCRRFRSMNGRRRCVPSRSGDSTRSGQHQRAVGTRTVLAQAPPARGPASCSDLDQRLPGARAGDFAALSPVDRRESHFSNT